ncbi:MAG: hypothetical protein ACRYG5_03030 [Janthinobacterium lividum]
MRQNKWLRTWLIISAVWALPIWVVAVHEWRVNLQYSHEDLDRSLNSWPAPAAGIPANLANACSGDLAAARAAGCPAPALALKMQGDNQAREQFSARKTLLVTYLAQAVFGYWIVPSLLVLLAGVIVAGVRLTLRRPASTARPAATRGRSISTGRVSAASVLRHH